MKVCPACGTEYEDHAAFCSRDRTPLRPLGSGLIGQLLGERYQVERKLGEGGMGEVYLARHVLMGRACAVKVVSPRLSRDPDAVGRFNREATNASRISHPNVCAVYDFGLTVDGLIYLAMEYIQGETLTETMAQSGPLDPERAGAIIAQCAAGLQVAHELGIVHRDLKPDNIMLVQQRGRETVKLVDFGIAKAAEGEGGQRVTRTGLVIGTPEYMSPEQVAGDSLDGHSDQYSLALVLYRMLTGKLPFPADSEQEKIAKRLIEPPLPLAAALPERRFPDALQQVLDRALERKPANRFATVQAFADAVQNAVRAPAPEIPTLVLGAPPTLAHTRVSSPERARWLRPLLTGGAVAVLGVAALGIWRWSRAGAGQNPVDSVVVAPQPPAPAPAGVVGDTTAPAVTDSAPRRPTGSKTPKRAGPQTNSAAAWLAPLPRLEDFEDPRSPRADTAARRAALAADASGRLPDSVRAEMAYLRGQWHLDLKQRRAARRWFQRSCALRRADPCSKMLEQLREDVP